MKLTPAAKKQLEDILGTSSVLTDELSVSLYAYDCSVSRTRPDAVLLITQTEQIAPVLQVLHQHRIPFVARGSATNHAGGCVALKGGVILNLTQLNQILEINTREGFVRVEPGVITADLQKKLAPLGYFYAPDPASQHVCTIGGNVAQNASGARCLKYGGTLEHVLAAKFVLADGTEHSLVRWEKGPDLLGLLCGSEGTLGVLTELKLQILPLCKHIQTFLITFPSLQSCIEAVSALIARGITPRCVEAMDKLTIQNIEAFAQAGYPVDAEALLILELDGSMEQIGQDAKTVEAVCKKKGALKIESALTEEERQALWRGRQSAFAAMARLSPNVMVGDGTVPRSRLPQALARVQQILQTNKVRAGLLFHAGDGNFHPHILFDERNKMQTAQATRVLREILKICVEEQGTLSGEHGIGVEKRALMAYEYDAATLTVMARIKQAFDPLGLANPLKILPHQFSEKARAQSPLLANVKAVQDEILSYGRTKTPFVICGGNTHLKTESNQVISAGSLQEIIEVDMENYTITAQAGVSLQTLHELLNQKGLYSVLPAQAGTLGGAFCSGVFPSFCTHVTGIEVLLADGSCIHYGGKVMKNAAGYPLTRLWANSQGTLGLVTQITFKVFAQQQSILKPQVFEEEPVTALWAQLRLALDPACLILNNTERKERG